MGAYLRKQSKQYNKYVNPTNVFFNIEITLTFKYKSKQIENQVNSS